MKLVDSHAHLDSPDFANDLPEILNRADDAGVRIILTIGCLGSPKHETPRVLSILECYPQVYGAFGVHPHDARFMNDRLEAELENLLDHERVLALGEIGLDHHYDLSPREAQLEAFRRQLEVARRKQMPIIVHTREAAAETAEILRGAFPAESRRSGVLHCFSGDPELAQVGLASGFYLGFGGVVTFRKADQVRASLLETPPDRLLLETDAPYLAPVPFRGKRNEPAFVRNTADEVARLTGRSLPDLARLTSGNFERLFGVSP
jgi:TatD DNase family protein